MAAFKLIVVLIGFAFCALASPSQRGSLQDKEVPEAGVARVSEVLGRTVEEQDKSLQVKDTVEDSEDADDDDDDQEVDDDDDDDDFPVVDVKNQPLSPYRRGCKGSECRRKCNKKGKNGVCAGPVCICWR